MAVLIFLGHLPGDCCMETKSMRLAPNSDLQRDRPMYAPVINTTLFYYIKRLRHPNWSISAASSALCYV